MSHTPSESVGKSQLLVFCEATNVHDTEVEPVCEAVTVTVSPAVTPAISIVGVTSFVTSSVDDTPLSEAVARSGFADAVGAIVLMVMLNAELIEEALPAGSVTVDVTLQLPSVNVGN
jgi:hypothetical protein